MYFSTYSWIKSFQLIKTIVWAHQWTFEHVFDFRETRKYKGNEKKLSLFVPKESVPSNLRYKLWYIHIWLKKYLVLNLFIKDEKGDKGIF